MQCKDILKHLGPITFHRGRVLFLRHSLLDDETWCVQVCHVVAHADRLEPRKSKEGCYSSSFMKIWLPPSLQLALHIVSYQRFSHLPISNLVFVIVLASCFVFGNKRRPNLNFFGNFISRPRISTNGNHALCDIFHNLQLATLFRFLCLLDDA